MIRQLFAKGREFTLGRGALAAWLAVGALLLVLSIIGLTQAARLNATIGVEQARQQLRGALETRVAAEGSTALDAYVRALVDRGAMGVRYIAIRVPGGTLVAEASAYDRVEVPMISPLYVERLRELMIGWAGPRERFTLERDGRVYATVEYVLASGAVAGSRIDAVSRLRAQSWLLFLAGMAALAVAVFPIMRPPVAARVDLAARARGGTAGSAAVAQEPDPATLEGRATQALDRLQRGVIIVDRDIRIRDINGIAEKLTGWSRRDAIGRLVYSVFHPLAEDDQPLTTPAETAVREQCETPATECRLRARDGSMRNIEMSAAVLSGRSDSVDGAVMFFHDISVRQQSMERLREEMQRTQDVVDHLDEGVLTTDASGVIQFANARAARMFGYRRQELIGASITKLMPVPFLNMPDVRVSDYREPSARARLPRVVGWRSDATTFPVDLLAQPLRHGEDGYQVLVLRDLTQQLRKDNLSLRMGRLFDAAAEEIYVFDAQSLYFTEVNHAAQKNLGYDDAQLARMTPMMICDGIDSESLQEHFARLRSGQVAHVHYRAQHRRADGSSYPVEVRLSYSRAEEPPVFMVMATDCSEREAAESRLARQVVHDELTGLANRAAAMSALRDAVTRAVQQGDNLAVVFVNLDRFKRINDSYGYDTGDAVLRLAAQRLGGLSREGCFVARLYGDEFVLIRPGIDDRGAAETLGERIADCFAQPLAVGERELRATASIGIAVYRAGIEDPLEPGELLARADRAMYLAKKAGRNRAHIYFGAEIGGDRSQRKA